MNKEDYTAFISENHENNINLLNDFALVLLEYMFMYQDNELCSLNFVDCEDFIGEIEMQDIKAKKVAHLHDTLLPYIKAYVRLDLGCKPDHITDVNEL